ncbi:hypothetical protein L7F22_007200 [Adiantum nelumboides]|nr:hypothetical protein [Adiantum nelumboides]
MAVDFLIRKLRCSTPAGLRHRCDDVLRHLGPPASCCPPVSEKCDGNGASSFGKKLHHQYGPAEPEAAASHEASKVASDKKAACGDQHSAGGRGMEGLQDQSQVQPAEVAVAPEMSDGVPQEVERPFQSFYGSVRSVEVPGTEK